MEAGTKLKIICKIEKKIRTSRTFGKIKQTEQNVMNYLKESESFYPYYLYFGNKYLVKEKIVLFFIYYNSLDLLKLEFNIRWRECAEFD